MIYALDGIAPTFPEDRDYWVAADANLIGNVALETATSIWFGATLRGDNEEIWVGAGSNIQENCVLHTDIGYPLHIGVNCTIGHKAMLHGCVIGDRSLSVMGATVVNGARISAGCLSVAASLTTSAKAIPDGSLSLAAARTLTLYLHFAFRPTLYR